MSVTPEAVTVSCDVAGCDWTFTGTELQADFEQRKHALVHDVDEEVGAYLEEKAAEDEEAEREKRHVGSLMPARGKTVAQMEAEQRVALNGQGITVRCIDCLFEAHGPAAEARLEWARHRRDQHGEDGVVERVQAELAGEKTKRPGRPTVGSKRQDVEENARQVRLQGGGQGMAQANGAKPRGWWTEERVVEALAAFVREHGRPVVTGDLVGDAMPRDPTVRRFFQSLKAANEAAAALLEAPPAPEARQPDPPPGPGEARTGTEHACSRAGARASRHGADSGDTYGARSPRRRGPRPRVGARGAAGGRPTLASGGADAARRGDRGSVAGGAVSVPGGRS